MAKFTKQVVATAYRFMPEELTGLDREYPEDIVSNELGFRVDEAEIGDDGLMHIEYYGHEGLEHVALKPGEWVVAPEMKVYPDEEFRQFATLVQ